MSEAEEPAWLREDTTVSIPRSLKNRLDDIKVFDSTSYADIIEHLADHYEGHAQESSTN